MIRDSASQLHVSDPVLPITPNEEKRLTEKIPRVALGLPVYNGENYLSQTLESILAQTFPDFELLISDNASTDRTPEICRKYVEKDVRVRYVRQNKNIGAAANYDFVFLSTRSQYFKWCAHDDLLGDRFIENCVAALDMHSDCVGAIPKEIRIIDETSEELSKVCNDIDPRVNCATDRFAHYVRQGYEPHCSPFFALYRRHALARSQLHGNYRSSDRVLISEMLLHGRILPVNGTHFAFRTHPEQYSRNLHKGISYYAHWLDPENDADIHFRELGYVSGLIGAVSRSPIKLSEKPKALYEIAKLSWDAREGLLDELRWKISVRAKASSLGKFLWYSTKKILNRSA